ncbi:MAG: recombinase RecT [Ruminococcus sp.]|nr:recombinase RecT [Ruminococcus sp.]MDE7226288.1 recombinase RecT [Ruminococcus sp.]
MENEIITLTETEQTPAVPVSGNFIDSFRKSYNLAKIFASSSLVPQQYQGKVADCAIAVDMANRMGVSPLMVMQSLYVVKGKPSWSGQACMSFIKARFKDAYPVYVGEKGTDSRGCYVKAFTRNGDVLDGTVVTLKMAKDENWTSNKKWSTMPEQMLAYRAAAFFARVYCPEVLMGVLVEGEAEDIENTENSRRESRTKKLTSDILGTVPQQSKTD